MVVATTFITGKYRVTLPKRVRESLGAEVGDRLTFVKGDDGLWRILVLPKDPVKALRLAGRALTPADFTKVHEEYEREADHNPSALQFRRQLDRTSRVKSSS